MRAAAELVVRFDLAAHDGDLALETGDGARQFGAANLGAVVADDAAGRLRDLVAQRFERVFLLELFVQLLDLEREILRIQRIEHAGQIGGRNRRAVQRVDGVGITHRRSVQVHAAIRAIQERAAVLLLELLERLLHRRRFDRGVAEDVRRHLFLQGLGIAEHFPGAAFVHRRRDVTLFGVVSRGRRSADACPTCAAAARAPS